MDNIIGINKSDLVMMVENALSTIVGSDSLNEIESREYWKSRAIDSPRVRGFSSDRTAFANDCANRVAAKILNGEVIPTQPEIKAAIRDEFQNYANTKWREYTFDSLGYVFNLVMYNEDVYNKVFQYWKLGTVKPKNATENSNSKNAILFRYFDEHGTKEKPREIIANLRAQGIEVTTNNVSVAKNRYLASKYLSGDISRPIDVAKKWFSDNGGEELSKDDGDYAVKICNLVREFKSIYGTNSDAAFTSNSLIAEDDGSPFYDFIQVIRYSNRYKCDIKDDYLRYVASIRFNMAVPKGLQGGLGHSLRYLNSNEELYSKKGDIITDKMCAYFIRSIGIQFPYERANAATIANFIQLIEKEYTDVSEVLNSMCAAVKNRGSRINPPKKIDTLVDVLHFMFYVIGYESFSQKKIMGSIQKIAAGPNMKLPRTIAFETAFRNINGGTYNEIGKLKNGHYLDNLFDPFYTPSKTEIYQIISWYLKCYGKLPETALSQEIGIPLEEIFTISSDCNFLLQSVSPSKYGGEGVFNIQNLINPNFTAAEAIHAIGESSYPKAKKKIETLYKNGERKDLSFLELVKSDNKIKEKTQRDVFLFLVANTNVKWIYEYNRIGKQDDKTLGKKSIDMMCNNRGTTYCVEYQGEQHFRPISVKHADENFADSLSIRDRILGVFNNLLKNSKTIEGAKKQAKQMIINELLSYSSEEKEILEMKSWLKDSLAKSNDVDDLYKKANRFPNYVLSPNRFMDEIDVSIVKQRDIEKINAVHNNGWKMIYILPGSTTINNGDIQYAASLRPDALFRWNSEGKGQIIEYLAKVGLKSVSESMMGRIFHELLLS